MLDKYPQKVKLVFKNFPLAMHKYAEKAAKAALAAHAQGKFWEYHKALVENYRSINDAKIEALARELGLDMRRFAEDMSSPVFEDLIARDVSNGQEIGVRGIPAVFVNGKRVKRRNFKVIEEMILAELKKR